MTDLPQKFRVSIELDLSKEDFDVKVVNVSERKGWVDMQELKARLHEIMNFMQQEGIEALTEQLDLKNLN